MNSKQIWPSLFVDTVLNNVECPRAKGTLAMHVRVFNVVHWFVKKEGAQKKVLTVLSILESIFLLIYTTKGGLSSSCEEFLAM